MNVNEKDTQLSKDAVEEILLACNRKIKNSKGKEDPLEGIKIFRKYFNPESPVYDINKPLPGQKQWTALAFTTWLGRTGECACNLEKGQQSRYSSDGCDGFGRHYCGVCIGELSYSRTSVPVIYDAGGCGIGD